ncbi:Alpha/beta hydrolase family protein [Microbulbifer aggregans]|uniref:Alpha/beta hydrolase family protein n=1 Tax=Microbulbifer aggregans TaxID=1769779 RepID=A0A1C9W8V2_9GAMM|nr:alpha/beta fold hydrolase [Microbulbifer aggregans]AOS97562.1 Alpha/beta hydrolase family protein [Microbulbifer aggregans]
MLVRGLLRLCFSFVLGVLLVLAVGASIYVARLPELQLWHTAILDEEFTADAGIDSFGEYLALEERLFAQLDREIYQRTAVATPDTINRFQRGSLADPERWSPNWNRSFLLEATAPRANVLLLHGLTDAPYSLRRLGETLHGAGATVLGLRIPGHGTAPSGLVSVRWQDMAAAVHLAIQDLASRSDGRPLYLVGYSNGAALAVHYALEALENPELPGVDKLVLISPEIGVAPMAALAIWQARLGDLLGIEKLQWNSIAPLEYEPFKYGAFAVNGGVVTHEITTEIRRRLLTLANRDGLGAMPPTLSFSSVIDATVLAPALVSNFYNLLPPGDHELVLFDVNRMAAVEHLLQWKPDRIIAAVRQVPQRQYTLTVVSNSPENSPAVAAHQWAPDQTEPSVEPLGLEWPDNIYSLSHVALPFAPDDSIYGGRAEGHGPGIQLGRLAMRGERGALVISPSAQLRLRWNPFYSWMEDRAVQFMELD